MVTYLLPKSRYENCRVTMRLMLILVLVSEGGESRVTRVMRPKTLFLRPAGSHTLFADIGVDHLWGHHEQ